MMQTLAYTTLVNPYIRPTYGQGFTPGLGDSPKLELLRQHFRPTPQQQHGGKPQGSTVNTAAKPTKG
jgi:hypothetical protein